MLCISNAKVQGVQNNNHKISFGDSHTDKPSHDNSNAIRNSLMALAILGMVGCSDNFSEDYTSGIEEAQRTELKAKTDSINTHRTLDEYMQDLGFLQNGNKLGDVENLYFEDMNGTKNYLVKGDSVNYGRRPSGIQFHGFSIDADGNKEEYNLKFEKYHQGLVVTKDVTNPNYKEGGVDTTRYEYSSGRIVERTHPSQPRDTVTYKFSAKPDGTYSLQKAEGKGIIFYCPVADVKKINDGSLLFEGYDWVKEQRTGDIEILQNFQNNVAIPKDED